MAKAGLKVVCIEPPQPVRPPVGESLDWSAPDLLRRLGLSPDGLLASRIATWKRHVTLKMRDGCDAHYVPSTWLGGFPFYVNLATLHVERTQLDDEILKLVVDQGVTFVRDRVVDLESPTGRFSRSRTEGGVACSLLRGSLMLPGLELRWWRESLTCHSLQYGPTKVGIWTYFKVPQQVEGTTLYMDPMPTEYLEWIWEIPVSPDTVSVGYVIPGAALKPNVSEGESIEGVFRQQLMKFPRFESLLQQEPSDTINVTSFRCRVYLDSAGPNWLIAGEAAVPCGSHDFERSYRGASPCSRGRGAHPEIPDAGGAAAARQEGLQHPDSADGEVL